MTGAEPCIAVSAVVTVAIMSLNPAMICCCRGQRHEESRRGKWAYWEWTLADDDKWATNDRDLLSRTLKRLRLGCQSTDIGHHLSRSNSRQSRHSKERKRGSCKDTEVDHFDRFKESGKNNVIDEF